MATKQVSVRLSATGGRQVRSELEGVGTAGRKAFERLPRDVERANAKLAAFARRVAVASAAAATAAAAAAVTATNAAMDRAFEVQRQAAVANADPQVFQGMAAGAQTVGIEQEKLADILKDVNDRVGDFLTTGGGPMADFFESIAPKVGVTADQFARLSGPEALQLYVSSLEQAGASQQEMTFYLEAMASDATRLIPLLANGGAEMGRLGEQAQALGAVLDTDAIAAMRRSELALVSMGQVFTGIRNKVAVALRPSLEAMANAFVALASSTNPVTRAFDAVLANLDRLAIYAGTFATFLAGRWVAAMAAAALSVRGLATGLVFLRGRADPHRDRRADRWRRRVGLLVHAPRGRRRWIWRCHGAFEGCGLPGLDAGFPVGPSLLGAGGKQLGSGAGRHSGWVSELPRMR